MILRRLAAYFVDVAVCFGYFAFTQSTIFALLRAIGSGLWMKNGALGLLDIPQTCRLQE